MNDIFYIIGLLFLFHEIEAIRNTKRRMIRRKNQEKLQSIDNKREAREFLARQPFSYVSMIFNLMYFSWLLVGVGFSNQWFVFFLFLLFSQLFGKYEKKQINAGSIKKYRMIKFDAAVSIIFIGTIIINHFFKLF